jgi:hypothetical protein
MKLSFVLTEQELLELDRIGPKASRTVSVSFVAILALVVILSPVVALLAWREQRYWDAGCDAMILPVGAVVFYFIHRRNRWLAKKHAAQGPVEIDGSETGICVQNSTIRTEFRWEAFVSYREGTGLFVLYFSDRSGIALPKRAFAADQDLPAFRQLLADKIGVVYPKKRATVSG